MQNRMSCFVYPIQRLLFMMACLCCINASWAYLNDKDLDSNLTKEQLQEKIRQHQEQEQQAILENSDTPNQNFVSLSNNELLMYQLNTALNNQNGEEIRRLLPIYEKTTNPDKILIYFAKAFLARQDHHFKLAVNYYQIILQENPELTPVRVYMLLPLIQDKRYHDAKKQITYIKNNKNVPNDILELIQDYEQSINKRQNIKANFSMRYLADNNINNAPKNNRWGNWQLPTADKAQGIGVDVYALKNHSLSGHLASKTSFSVYSKTYHNNRKYNDLILRASSGLAVRDATKEIALMPFFEKRIYGNHNYWKSMGVRLQGSAPFSEKMDGFFALQYAKKQHNQRKFLDGNIWSASMTSVYNINASCYANIGSDYVDENTQDLSESYQKWSLRTGFGCQNQTIGTEMGLNFTKKLYDSDDLFGIRRKDKDYEVWLSVYSPKIHWQGFTPKVITSYQHTDSNHFLGQVNDKKEIFLEIEKRF